MAVKFGGDISGQKAIRALNSATDIASRTRERLATGLRINRASDDAALLAVSEGLSVESRIMRQGVRNISDGISVVAIADAALASISEIVTRMVELAEQAGNGVYNSTQRKALDKEYQALSQEIQRIGKTTTFNGIDLLAGERGMAELQQITSITTGSGVTSNDQGIVTSADGRTVVIHNATTNQLEYIDTESGARTVIATATLAAEAGGNFSPRIAADASTDIVAFVSTSNLTGQNGSGLSQVFVYNRQTGVTSQITRSQGAELFLGLTVSADGSTIAFDSITDYGGTPTYGTSQEIYTYNLQTGAFTDMGHPDDGGLAGGFSLSSDGAWLSFVSTSTNGGQNVDGSTERFIVSTANPTGTFRQVTSLNGQYDLSIVPAYVTREGDIYFSSALNYTGENTQLAGQLFHYSRTSDSIRQITTTSAGGIFLLHGGHDGRSLHFVADYEPNGGGLGHYFGFTYDLQSGAFERGAQVPGPLAASDVSISADGSRVFFLSSSNLINNADGNSELYSLTMTNNSLALTIETGQGRSSSIQIGLDAVTESVRGLGGYVLSSDTGARGALRGLRANVAALSELRGKLGAGAARLDTAHRLGNAQANELAAAASRIRDVDVAASASELVAAQIRQQIATFIVAQANQQGSISLQLLTDAAPRRRR